MKYISLVLVLLFLSTILNGQTNSGWARFSLEPKEHGEIGYDCNLKYIIKVVESAHSSVHLQLNHVISYTPKTYNHDGKVYSIKSIPKEVYFSDIDRGLYDLTADVMVDGVKRGEFILRYQIVHSEYDIDNIDPSKNTGQQFYYKNFFENISEEETKKITKSKFALKNWRYAYGASPGRKSSSLVNYLKEEDKYHEYLRQAQVHYDSGELDVAKEYATRAFEIKQTKDSQGYLDAINNEMDRQAVIEEYRSNNSTYENKSEQNSNFDAKTYIEEMQKQSEELNAQIDKSNAEMLTLMQALFFSESNDKNTNSTQSSSNSQITPEVQAEEYEVKRVRKQIAPPPNVTKRIAKKYNPQLRKKLLDDGYFIDGRDGQKYTIAEFGDDIWMTSNLNYGSNRSMCYNASTKNCEKYGKLYYINNATHACPDGWHLPTKEEWDALIKIAGGKHNGGLKLKSTSGWKKKGNGNNKLGFNALPAGNKTDYLNKFKGIGEVTFWWGNSISNFCSIGHSYIISLNNYTNKINYYCMVPGQAAYSIRCVSDY